MDQAEKSRDGVILTSRPSLTECFTKPRRQKDRAALDRLQLFFGTSGFEVLSVNDGLVDIATDLQNDLALKAIDALQVATAIRAEADVFLTRDIGISRYPLIRGVRTAHIS